MTKRAYLTDKEKRAMLAEQDGNCAICGGPMFSALAEFDHSTPHAFRPDRKPDQAVHAGCHRDKTRKDVKAIAKAKRLHRTFVLGEKKAKRKMQSRGFDKRWSRRLNGSVVPREGAQP